MNSHTDNPGMPLLRVFLPVSMVLIALDLIMVV